jgi:hypothetical protein
LTAFQTKRLLVAAIQMKDALVEPQTNGLLLRVVLKIGLFLKVISNKKTSLFISWFYIESKTIVFQVAWCIS